MLDNQCQVAALEHGLRCHAVSQFVIPHVTECVGMLVDTLKIEHERPCMSYKSLNLKYIAEFLYNIQ